jgi:putative ABC transport system permease protein
MDLRMAWRNIWRNTRRSILTITAIAFATTLLVFMLSWQFGSYETMVQSAIAFRTGHLQIQAEGYMDKGDIRLAVRDPAAVGHILEKIPGIKAYTSRTSAFAIASSRDRTYGVVVVGIDPGGEARVTTLSRLIRQGQFLAIKDDHRALLGDLLARNLQLRPGDELVTLGQGFDGSIAADVFSVKGIFSSGQDEFDRSFVYVPLGSFQEMYAMDGAVHEVVVLCESLGAVAPVKKAIQAGLGEGRIADHLVVLDWMELMPGLVQGIQMDLYSGLIFYFILIVVVAFSILNTFLMNILERTKELGVLMAVGTTPGRLMRMLLLESTLMTLIGIIVGVITGSLITWYFQVHGIVIAGTGELLRQFGLPERMYPKLSFLSISVGVFLVLGITLLTALYPAFKVMRLRPVEAIKTP